MGSAGLTEVQMTVRSVVAAIVVAAVAFPVLAGAGQPAAPRTPWGDPDLQGTYTNKTVTPLQRPPELAGRDRLTAEEVANLEREILDRNAALLARPALRTAVTESVDSRGRGAGVHNNSGSTRHHVHGQTSLIVDRPTAAAARLTPEARADEDARLAARGRGRPATRGPDMDLKRPGCMCGRGAAGCCRLGYNNNT